MLNRETGGFVPEEFESAMQENKSKGEEKSPQEKKVSRRHFLKTGGAALASFFMPEVTLGQEEKAKPKEKDPVKEGNILAAKKRYENIKKISDLDERRLKLKELQLYITGKDITLDDLSIEAKKEKDIRMMRGGVLGIISSSKSRKAQRLGIDFITKQMQDFGITWADLKLEKDNEDISRLLPIKEQLDQAVWFGGSGEDKLLLTLGLQFKGILLRNAETAEKFLDLYYNVKNKLVPYRIYAMGGNDKEDTLAHMRSDFSDFLQLYNLKMRNMDNPMAAQVDYEVDRSKDKELYEHLTKLEKESGRQTLDALK